MQILDEKLAGFAGETPAAAMRFDVPPIPDPVILFSGLAGGTAAGPATWVGARAYGRGKAFEPSPRMSRPPRKFSAAQLQALDRLRGFGAASLGPASTDDDIRSAFRSLARRFHPDRHPGVDEAERRRLAGTFGSITQAYRELIRSTAN